MAADPRLARATRSNGSSELLLRVASALVLAPLAIITAYVGGWLFVLAWAIAACGVLREWVHLVNAEGRLWIEGAGMAGLVAAALCFGLGRPEWAILLLAIGGLTAAGLTPAGRRAWVLAGGLYAGVLLAAPAVLRHDAEFGFVAVLFLFAVVWATDIAAYFSGRLLGGPRLWPAVSPNKTWSGAIGGAVASIAVGIALASASGLHNLPVIATVALGLSVAAQAGDLLESAVKRRFGAKEASHLIPGHGGLMDRLDGFLAAAVVGMMLGLLHGGMSAPARGLLLW